MLTPIDLEMNQLTLDPYLHILPFFPPLSPLLTHPIQAPQIFDFVLVCSRFIIDDRVLFVDTAGLQTQTHI